MNRKSVEDPMYVLIKNDLIGEIISGKWAPDKPMDSESALVGRYQASRGTIRRAFDELVDAGLVIRKPGKGTFALRVNASYLPSTSRPIVQGSSFSANIPGAVTQLLDKRLYPGMDGEKCDDRIIQAFGCSPETKIILIKRLRIGKEGPYSIQSAYLLEEQFPLVMGYGEKDLTSLGKIYQQSGRIITRGTEDLHTELVTEEEHALLKMEPDEKYVIHRERHSFDQNKRILEVLVAVDHLLRYRYKYEFVQDLVFEKLGDQ